MNSPFVSRCPNCGNHNSLWTLVWTDGHCRHCNAKQEHNPGRALVNIGQFLQGAGCLVAVLCCLACLVIAILIYLQ